ncbi:helix-turn-helix domain-containing protein [Mycolicibacterium septicum]|uniref:Helix-turn-helix domain-containing protein n=1 Tax=Mycolicibacterium septicum TaxID=98668 RepID=A0ABW9M4X5_9MYCO
MTPRTSRLGMLVRQHKQRSGMPDTELAQRIGISRQALSNWLSGNVKSIPSQENLRSAAAVLDVPYHAVLDAALHDSGWRDSPDEATQRSYHSVLYDAITALTEAARLTTSRTRRTPSGGWEPDPDAPPEPIDWAAFATQALAGAAANIGSISKILSGRPGSWEADKIGETLLSTVGDDITDPATLLAHRTEPVTVTLWVESILRDFDYAYDDAYEAAALSLDEQAGQLEQPPTRKPGPFRTDDPRLTAFSWIDVDDQGWLQMHFTQGPAELSETETALLNELQAEAIQHWDSLPPAPGEAEYDAQIAAFNQLEQDLLRQRDRELADYAQHLTDAITAGLSALKLAVPVTVTVTRAPEDATSYDSLDPGAPPDPHGWTTPIDHVVLTAIEETPLPSRLPGTPLSRLQSTEPSSTQPNTTNEE